MGHELHGHATTICVSNLRHVMIVELPAARYILVMHVCVRSSCLKHALDPDHKDLSQPHSLQASSLTDSLQDMCSDLWDKHQPILSVVLLAAVELYKCSCRLTTKLQSKGAKRRSFHFSDC